MSSNSGPRSSFYLRYTDYGTHYILSDLSGQKYMLIPLGKGGKNKNSNGGSNNNDRCGAKYKYDNRDRFADSISDGYSILATGANTSRSLDSMLSLLSNHTSSMTRSQSEPLLDSSCSLKRAIYRETDAEMVGLSASDVAVHNSILGNIADTEVHGIAYNAGRGMRNNGREEAPEAKQEESGNNGEVVDVNTGNGGCDDNRVIPPPAKATMAAVADPIDVVSSDRGPSRDPQNRKRNEASRWNSKEYCDTWEKQYEEWLRWPKCSKCGSKCPQENLCHCRKKRG